MDPPQSKGGAVATIQSLACQNLQVFPVTVAMPGEKGTRGDGEMAKQEEEKGSRRGGEKKEGKRG